MRARTAPATIKSMAGFGRRFSRRSFLVSSLGVRGFAREGSKGTSFSPQWEKYSDPTTEFQVYRLTDPSYSSTLPPYYNRTIARNSGWMIFCCDQSGSPQAFSMNLKTGAMRQLTDAQDLDRGSLTLTPTDRSLCYFAGRSLYIAGMSTLRDHELYRVPDGWERAPGLTVGPDGTHATFAERRGERSRIRMVSLGKGAVRTAFESGRAIGHPIPRPRRAQILYRQDDSALWLVNSDGTQDRQLKTAAGTIGPANWAPDGKTVLYLNFPEDPRQLNNIREIAPDSNTDKLVSKTSQFVSFGFNRNTSVFVGASRNKAAPYVLILLREVRRELTLCEHKSSHPETVAPRFSPDSQRIYFQSDRDGKPALYSIHVEKLVEKTGSMGVTGARVREADASALRTADAYRPVVTLGVDR